jgi:hypothetical protein
MIQVLSATTSRTLCHRRCYSGIDTGNKGGLSSRSMLPPTVLVSATIGKTYEKFIFVGEIVSFSGVLSCEGYKKVE